MTNSSNQLDGKGLYYSFLAGAKRVFENQQILNKMNVFPVADADTGTNIASTMRSIVDTFIPTTSIKTTAVALADAALVGARGNSGIIFAQFLYGFSNEIKEDGSISVQNFAHYLKNGVQYAYQAISNPVEGTMITVIREWAEDVYKHRNEVSSFNELIVLSYKKALISLAETKEKLAVLAKNNVVDAGAKAFVLFLEGIIEFLKTGRLKELISARNIVKVKEIAGDGISHEDITFRYCTEALITGDKLNRNKIKRYLESLGDSLVIAGSEQKMRIHIHTDQPSAVFSFLNTQSLISYQKVDDMIMQQEVTQNPIAPIAIVTDSTCDLPQDLIDRHQIHIVPLTVHFGDRFFLDGITLTSEHFKKLYFKNKDKVYPSTAQPAFKDFTNKFNYLSTHYDDIIALQLTSRMSGTWGNSSKAAKSISLQTKKNISVIDSTRLSGGLGLLVLRAALAAEEGISHDEIVKLIELWKTKSLQLVTASTVKYLVKSGRVSPVKGALGNLLKLKPFITINAEGAAETTGKYFTESKAANTVLNKIKQTLINQTVWNYAITHFENEEWANWYATEIKKITGKDPLFVKQGSPVLSANVGPGVVSVSILLD
jgi:DegV family protein with EDD domain